MAVSDDKQNRLSTLSQDVIAVPKKPPAPSAAAAPRQPAAESRVETPPRPAEPRAPERKAIPATQDVFRVAAPAADLPPPPPPAAMRQVPGVRPAPARGLPALEKPSPLLLGTGAVAVLALLVSIYALTAGSSAAPGDNAVVEKLTVDLAAANERVARLEARLSAASADAQKLGAPGQGNILQISAGMRELRDDLDGVTNEVANITTQVGELRTLAGGGAGQAKLAMAQVEQVASRVATLNEQVASLPRGGGGGGGGGDVQAQLKSLSAKTDKLAADIRQLYRQVGSQ